MPICSNVTASCAYEPPYSVFEATMCSPARASVRSATICAAIPVDAASAARPPSSAATRSSSAATVGLEIRE